MTVYPSIRLEAATLDDLTIDTDGGFYGQRLDLGDPITRDVAINRPGANGTIDTTMLIGARTVTLSVILADDTDLWALRQSLRAFTHPTLRPYMFVQLSSTAPELRIRLRRSQYNDVIGEGWRPSSAADPDAAYVTVQWVAPDGVLEDDEQHIDIDPATSEVATNAGTFSAFPTIAITGPAENPTIRNDTTGMILAFTVNLGSGDTLIVDTATKTIVDEHGQDCYSLLDLTVSRWWTIEPGVNDIIFDATTHSSPATTVVTWRDTYL